jgi:hypothetical protein
VFGAGTPVDGRPLVKAIFPFGPATDVAELTAGATARTIVVSEQARTRRRIIYAVKLQQN